MGMTNQRVHQYLFLLLGVLFTYPLIWDIYWWGWSFGAALKALFACSHLCFGLALQFWLPRYRWIVWFVLSLTAVFIAPQALTPLLFARCVLQHGVSFGDGGRGFEPLLRPRAVDDAAQLRLFHGQLRTG